MANKNKEAPSQTVIGVGCDLIGDYVFQGSVVVNGHIKGNLVADEASQSTVEISRGGKVEGEIRARYIHLSGIVIGNAYATELIKLDDGCYMRGNVYYKAIEMAPGAELNGAVEQKK